MATAEAGAVRRGIVRWGIIGAGDIAERVMAPAMRGAKHADLVAVCRRDRARVEEFAARHGARRAYTRPEDLLADPEIDAVYVATPVDRHYPDVLAAAEAGKAILVEKPMALSVAEAERMAEAAGRRAVPLWVCFYQRYNARHQRIRDLLREGRIARVTSVRMSFSGRSPERAGAWRQDPRQAGGGSFMDSASHCVDLTRFLFGDVEAVAALAETLAEGYQVEDTATALLRLDSGVQVVIGAHWSIEDPSEARTSVIEIGGTAGTIVSWPLHDKFSRGRLIVATPSGEQEEDVGETSTHVALLEDFARRLGLGEPPAIGATDGIEALRVVEAVYASSRSRQFVRLR